MKVVFPTCCGVDVHKTFLVATIITTPTDSLQPHYQKKRFSTFNSDLNRFADWLLEHNCLDVLHGVHRKVLGSCVQYP